MFLKHINGLYLTKWLTDRLGMIDLYPKPANSNYQVFLQNLISMHIKNL